MVAFYGDYDTTETVYIPFNTFSSDDPSASVTITNLVAGDIDIHKDGSTTQRSSSAGITVSVDFDSITGNHLVAIDLSDNTDAGYYANGSTYQVRMEGTTVDGATVNAWIGSFSIGRMLRPTTSGRTLDVETGGCAGIDWGNIANKTTTNDLSGTDIQLCDTVTTNTDMRGTDSAALASVCTEARLAELAAANLPADIDAILTDTGTTLDNHLTDIKGTGFVKDTHSLVDIEAYADLIDDGTSGLAKIATDVAAILVDTGTTIPATITTAQNDLDIITGAAGVVIADGTITAAKLGADCITNAKIADDAIAAENLATGAIAADAVAATALDNIVMSDLAAVPAATASIVAAINWLFEVSRNRIITNGTNSELELYKDDATTKFAEADISDDGTDFERGEWGAVD